MRRFVYLVTTVVLIGLAIYFGFEAGNYIGALLFGTDEDEQDEAEINKVGHLKDDEVVVDTIASESVDKKKVKQQLLEFFKTYNPEKVNTVDKALEKFDLNALNVILLKKYGADLNTFASQKKKTKSNNDNEIYDATGSTTTTTTTTETKKETQSTINVLPKFSSILDSLKTKQFRHFSMENQAKKNALFESVKLLVVGISHLDAQAMFPILTSIFKTIDKNSQKGEQEEEEENLLRLESALLNEDFDYIPDFDVFSDKPFVFGLELMEVYPFAKVFVFYKNVHDWWMEFEPFFRSFIETINAEYDRCEIKQAEAGCISRVKRKLRLFETVFKVPIKGRVKYDALEIYLIKKSYLEFYLKVSDRLVAKAKQNGLSFLIVSGGDGVESAHSSILELMNEEKGSLIGRAKSKKAMKQIEDDFYLLTSVDDKTVKNDDAKKKKKFFLIGLDGFKMDVFLTAYVKIMKKEGKKEGIMHVASSALSEFSSLSACLDSKSEEFCSVLKATLDLIYSGEQSAKKDFALSLSSSFSILSGSVLSLFVEEIVSLFPNLIFISSFPAYEDWIGNLLRCWKEKERKNRANGNANQAGWLSYLYSFFFVKEVFQEKFSAAHYSYGDLELKFTTRKFFFDFKHKMERILPKERVVHIDSSSSREKWESLCEAVARVGDQRCTAELLAEEFPKPKLDDC